MKKSRRAEASPGRKSSTLRRARLATVLVCLSGSAAWADLESDLNRSWRGAWVVTGIETVSGCSGSYTNNEVVGGLVAARGGERFDRGELAQVHKINLTRKRIEVFLDLEEPVLIPRQDGPFTLFDERFCKVELRLDLGGRSSRAIDLDAVIEAALMRFPDRRTALEAEAWNRRQRAPYPEDYDQTLAAYERWKIFETNAAVQAGVDRSMDEAARILDRLSMDEDSLAGFGAGVDDAREKRWSEGCERLLSMSESSWSERAPSGRSGAWRRGFDHGQRLVFHLERARRLRGCFVPPPME